MTTLARLQKTISETETRYHRLAGSVRLIAVSKTRSAAEIQRLIDVGQTEFGENYLQEALPKQAQLSNQTIQWHFIGAIQSKKAQQIAEHFDWVHSVDRLKVANKLNEARGARPPLNVMIQVNLESEGSKGGIAPDELNDLAQALNQLPNLKLRGLMFMPMLHRDFDAQRAIFREGQALFAQLQAQYPAIDQMSMGMSGDMIAAIAAGSTMVRVGTALFGERN